MTTIQWSHIPYYVSDPLDYLKRYKHVRRYNPELEETVENLLLDGNLLYDGYTYTPRLYRFFKRPEGKQQYVAFGIELTEEQSKRLAPHCQCSVCNMSVFNPAKYITCRCCVGCIKSIDNASQENIARAIEKEKEETGTSSS